MENVEKQVRIIKADDRQIVYGVVLEPDTIDAHEDTISADEIEKTAHGFLLSSGVVGDSHRGLADARVAESYIAPVDFELGGQLIKKGSWVMAIKVHSEPLWKSIRDGDYTGLSIGAYGRREPI